MTAYNPPTDTELGIEKPILSSVNIRLRDMAIAITEGASGAPKIQEAAIDAGVVGIDKLKETVYSTDIDLVLGKTTGTTSSTSWTNVGGKIIAQMAGQYNLRAELSMAPTNDYMYGRVYVNGAAYGTERSSNQISAAWNEDLALSEGDKVEIYARHGNGASTVTATVKCIATGGQTMGGNP